MLIPSLLLVLLTHRLSFPLLVDPTPASVVRRLDDAFSTLVSDDYFFEKSADCTSSAKGSSAKVPLFGSSALVSFRRATPDSFLLTVSGCTAEQFGWICVKFYEERRKFKGLNHSGLRRATAEHFNSLPPHPGYDAHAPWSVTDADPSMTSSETDLASEASAALVRSLFPDSVLEELSEEGFVVIDDAFSTSPAAANSLTEHLTEAAKRTNQSVSIRTDRVAFLSRSDARSCGLQSEYDMLMAVAPFLNDNVLWTVEKSSHAPVSPGTAARPLTNPRNIQVAEYGEGDFYATHSDNGLDEGGGRRNYRYLTYIYYLNDGWSASDGGALRIRRRSGDFETMEAAAACCDFEDVLPVGGRLLVFDSRLAHEVRPNVNGRGKIRRALTLWATRPEESGARGEVWDEGTEGEDKDEID
ncbi:hypothetical protein TrST_g2080 [Triparma strigata]|uniref:Fe2OG dioxygenase domain-containing protein n=1 Tax=Triparma strigata TaxID=1606541 RepID=A0A9W7ADN0_9STRA|nr:hypothetical protein TrST_g2080 [Triparma strigata]